MTKKKFSPSKIKKITGASRHETISVPFYYAPPFLDELREWLKTKLSSQGGRPTIEGLEVIRKIRFSRDNWKELELIAENWSQSGISVSPSQVAASVLEKFISGHRKASFQEEKVSYL